MTSAMSEEPPPHLAVRWMRPLSSSALLELPTAPVVVATSNKDISWQAFTAGESLECETAWQNLTDEDRKVAEEGTGAEDAERTTEDIDDEDEDTIGVSIAKDKLFEVDVRSMRVSLQYVRHHCIRKLILL